MFEREVCQQENSLIKGKKRIAGPVRRPNGRWGGHRPAVVFRDAPSAAVCSKVCDLVCDGLLSAALQEKPARKGDFLADAGCSLRMLAIIYRAASVTKTARRKRPAAGRGNMGDGSDNLGD
jgi:hypothetical protein